MKIIKLRTIASTNSFLKELVKETKVASFTVVVTEQQTFGRGQVHQKWISEPFKNLTFSMFVSFDALLVAKQKFLNFAVSLAVFEVLKALNLPNVKIKWPNDILSDKKKLCGILIENQLQQTNITSSIIGIGLNVNQTNFKQLPNATSVKNKTNQETDLDSLLQSLTSKIKEKVLFLSEEKYLELETEYLKNLYKYQIPSMFKNIDNSLFMAKIIGISSEGKLRVELEDETIKEFGIKEISFV